MVGDKNSMIDPAPTGRVAAFSVAEAGEAAGWRWLDEKLCREWVLKRLYPAGPRCPVCGVVVREGKALESWWQLRRVCCHSCKRYYRATKGTILHHCSLKVRQIVMLAWAFDLGLNNSIAAGLAGSDQATARFWRLRLLVISNNIGESFCEEVSNERV